MDSNEPSLQSPSPILTSHDHTPAESESPGNNDTLRFRLIAKTRRRNRLVWFNSADGVKLRLNSGGHNPFLQSKSTYCALCGIKKPGWRGHRTNVECECCSVRLCIRVPHGLKTTCWREWHSATELLPRVLPRSRRSTATNELQTSADATNDVGKGENAKDGPTKRDSEGGGMNFDSEQQQDTDCLECNIPERAENAIAGDYTKRENSLDTGIAVTAEHNSHSVDFVAKEAMADGACRTTHVDGERRAASKETREYSASVSIKRQRKQHPQIARYLPAVHDINAKSAVPYLPDNSTVIVGADSPLPKHRQLLQKRGYSMSAGTKRLASTVNDARIDQGSLKIGQGGTESMKLMQGLHKGTIPNKKDV